MTDNKQVAVQPRMPSSMQAFSMVRDHVELAERLATSPLLPPNFLGSTQKRYTKEEVVANLIMALQYGAEVGLSPMQSVQSIAVINNRPSLYGDAMIGVVQASGLLDDLEETYDDKQRVATCVAKRGKRTVKRQFGWADAELAGLVNRNPVYKQYPKRMLQMRARSWALRDLFPDVLKGLVSREEAEEGALIEVNPAAEPANMVQIAVPEREPQSMPAMEAPSITAEPEPAEAVEETGGEFDPRLTLTLGTNASGKTDWAVFKADIETMLAGGADPAEVREANKGNLQRFVMASPKIGGALMAKLGDGNG